MVFELVGYRHKSFKAGDGSEITGYDLYLEGTDPYVNGKTVERIFASDRKCEGYIPVLGDEIDLQYNRYGKLDCIRRCE